MSPAIALPPPTGSGILTPGGSRSGGGRSISPGNAGGTGTGRSAKAKRKARKDKRKAGRVGTIGPLDPGQVVARGRPTVRDDAGRTTDKAAKVQRKALRLLASLANASNQEARQIKKQLKQLRDRFARELGARIVAQIDAALARSDDRRKTPTRPDTGTDLVSSDFYTGEVPSDFDSASLPFDVPDWMQPLLERMDEIEGLTSKGKGKGKGKQKLKITIGKIKQIMGDSIRARGHAQVGTDEAILGRGRARVLGPEAQGSFGRSRQVGPGSEGYFGHTAPGGEIYPDDYLTEEDGYYDPYADLYADPYTDPNAGPTADPYGYDTWYPGLPNAGPPGFPASDAVSQGWDFLPEPFDFNAFSQDPFTADLFDPMPQPRWDANEILRYEDEPIGYSLVGKDHILKEVPYDAYGRDALREEDGYDYTPVPGFEPGVVSPFAAIETSWDDIYQPYEYADDIIDDGHNPYGIAIDDVDAADALLLLEEQLGDLDQAIGKKLLPAVAELQRQANATGDARIQAAAEGAKYAAQMAVSNYQAGVGALADCHGDGLGNPLLIPALLTAGRYAVGALIGLATGVGVVGTAGVFAGGKAIGESAATGIKWGLGVALGVGGVVVALNMMRNR